VIEPRVPDRAKELRKSRTLGEKAMHGRSEHDAEKNRFLKSRGFTVIRVRDADAFANLKSAFSSSSSSSQEE
jgi:very-short-patch-repair endonuclease